MRRIEVEGLFNARAVDAGVPWLVRTGATENLTPAGVATLRQCGVGVIVDLREPFEQGPINHDIPVHPVSIYGTNPPDTGRLEDIYEGLLRTRGAALADAVAVVADAQSAALVHCTAGKDRTGLVVALARLAAGATAAEVIDDYELSGAEVRPVRAAHAETIAAQSALDDRADILRLHLDSPREAIAHALAVIDEWGGAAEYLRAHGLRGPQLAALRAKRERALDAQPSFAGEARS